MTETRRWFRHRDLEELETLGERDALMEGLSQTQTAIQQTYRQFNSTDDPDLIEAAVYEIKAHQSRYSYFLRRLKALDQAIGAQFHAE